MDKRIQGGRPVLTSKMSAVMNPSRCGLTVIDTFYGVHRARPDQSLLIKGDLVKDKKGMVHRFVYKEGDQIFVERV